MKRGEIYRVHRPAGDPKKNRLFVIVSRQVLIDSKFSTLICAPIFSNGQDLSTQVAIGPDEGLKHPSWITCDNLISVRKAELSHFIAQLSPRKIAELDRALRMALSI
ncbi:MAG TPA: type II toxin-antitoxin system PemK/MazF family toxin [Candidatus Angelobacter sp.]|jgi:mRNA interferase MazF